MSNILVVSEGPPPLGGTIAEGGALRAWGLANGLAYHGHKVTFVYRSTFEIADDADLTNIRHNLTVDTWSIYNLSDLIDAHEVIVMRYAMGEAGIFVDHLKPHHILVSDSYIPISVEVSARNSEHKDELINYLRLQKSSAHVTHRADYYLYASPEQRLYYLGYLSGLNKLNPVTYDSLAERMFELPYGVFADEKPASVPHVIAKNPSLLWYGAFYPWFNMEALVEPMLRIKKHNPDFKLIIAGAKNPYNKEPALLRHYEKTIKSLKPLGDSVEYLPWGPYSDRFKTYSQASAIITFNHPGLENELAWRTRLMDFVLADRPILTNGGDPLGEDLIRRGIAFRITADNLHEVFQSVIAKPPSSQQYTDVMDRYSWFTITEPLANVLKDATRLVETETKLKITFRSHVRHLLKDILRLPIRIVKYLKRYGLKRTLKRMLGVK